MQTSQENTQNNQILGDRPDGVELKATVRPKSYSFSIIDTTDRCRSGRLLQPGRHHLHRAGAAIDPGSVRSGSDNVEHHQCLLVGDRRGDSDGGRHRRRVAILAPGDAGSGRNDCRLLCRVRLRGGAGRPRAGQPATLHTQLCGSRNCLFGTYPEPFTRFFIYGSIALVQVFALFVIGWRIEDRIRQGEVAPEWRR